MKKLTILLNHNVRGTLFRIGSLLLFALTMNCQLYAQGGILDPNGPQGAWQSGNSKVYTLGNRVGIGTTSPVRRLHVWEKQANGYLRVTAEGGNTLAAGVAGLELERRISGTNLRWDVVNQGAFKIRRNSTTLFSLHEDEAQLGTQADKMRLNIWGDYLHVNNSGQPFGGSLVIRSSSIAEDISTMRLDGHNIDSDADLYLNFVSDSDIRMAKDGNVGIGAVTANDGAKFGIKSEQWQMNLKNNNKFWKIGVSNND